jgi:hypothetical protein
MDFFSDFKSDIKSGGCDATPVTHPHFKCETVAAVPAS